MTVNPERVRKLTSRQRMALPAVLSEPTIAEAAKKAKIGLSTLKRYLRDPLFREHLERAYAEAVAASMARLTRLLELADTALERGLVGGNVTAPEIRAVVAAHEIIHDTHRAFSFEERLARLEKEMGIG